MFEICGSSADADGQGVYCVTRRATLFFKIV